MWYANGDEHPIAGTPERGQSPLKSFICSAVAVLDAGKPDSFWEAGGIVGMNPAWVLFTKNKQDSFLLGDMTKPMFFKRR